MYSPENGAAKFLIVTDFDVCLRAVPTLIGASVVPFSNVTAGVSTLPLSRFTTIVSFDPSTSSNPTVSVSSGSEIRPLSFWLKVKSASWARAPSTPKANAITRTAPNTRGDSIIAPTPETGITTEENAAGEVRLRARRPMPVVSEDYTRPESE
jgi:hypothetical protein